MYVCVRVTQEAVWRTVLRMLSCRGRRLPIYQVWVDDNRQHLYAGTSLQFTVAKLFCPRSVNALILTGYIFTIKTVAYLLIDISMSKLRSLLSVVSSQLVPDVTQLIAVLVVSW